MKNKNKIVPENKKKQPIFCSNSICHKMQTRISDGGSIWAKINNLSIGYLERVPTHEIIWTGQKCVIKIHPL